MCILFILEMKDLTTWGPLNAVKALPVTASVGRL
jgi:hypothetical protein